MKPTGECFGLTFWTFRKYIDAFVPSLRAHFNSTMVYLHGDQKLASEEAQRIRMQIF
jgi:hypothetical protein